MRCAILVSTVTSLTSLSKSMCLTTLLDQDFQKIIVATQKLKSHRRSSTVVSLARVISLTETLCGTTTYKQQCIFFLFRNLINNFPWDVNIRQKSKTLPLTDSDCYSGFVDSSVRYFFITLEDSGEKRKPTKNEGKINLLRERRRLLGGEGIKGNPGNI